MVVARVWGGRRSGGKWRDIGQRVTTFSFKMIKFWGSIISVVTIVSNTVVYIPKNLLREGLNEKKCNTVR